MEKVTEIKLIKEGKQLKKILEEKYSYQELSEIFKLKESTLKSYFRLEEIKLKAFITELELLFQKPYHEIVNTIENQVKDYVLAIKNTVLAYHTRHDHFIVGDCYHYALRYCQPFVQLMAHGNYGVFYYNANSLESGIYELEKMLKSCDEHDFKELIVHYSIHLARTYSEQKDVDKRQIRRVLKRVQLILDDEASKEMIPQEDTLNYYSFYGDVLREWGESKKARDMYNFALDYTTDQSKIANIFINIGLTYYQQKKYDTTIEWCNKALEQGEINQDVICRCMNYLSLVYHKKGDEDKMIDYVSHTFKNLSDSTEKSIKVEIFNVFDEVGVFDAFRRQVEQQKLEKHRLM